MARATVGDLIEQIGQSVQRAHETAGEKVYDIHIFLQTYPTQEGRDYYTVHCDQSYVAYGQRDEYTAAEEALRAELPNDVFDLDYDEEAYESAGEAFDAEIEEAV